MLAYACSKFLCGVLMDFVSPKLALTGSLIAIGASAYLFASKYLSCN